MNEEKLPDCLEYNGEGILKFRLTGHHGRAAYFFLKQLDEKERKEFIEEIYDIPVVIVEPEQ